MSEAVTAPRTTTKRVRLTDLLNGKESTCSFPAGRLRISASYDDIEDDLVAALYRAGIVVYVEHEAEDAMDLESSPDSAEEGR